MIAIYLPNAEVSFLVPDRAALVGEPQEQSISLAYYAEWADNIKTFGDRVMIAADRLNYLNGSRIALPAEQLIEIGYWDAERGEAVITSGWSELVEWCGAEPILTAHTYRYDLQRSLPGADPATKYWIERQLNR